MTTFDPSAAKLRLENLWKLRAKFGMERKAYYTYLDELVTDRFQLINGLQVLRDELQFATDTELSDLVACGADLSVPTVVTTLAHTNCGDRIHQGEATKAYERVVASRFATISEIGELKLESFAPTGGGTDDGATLAHVTVAHALDKPLKERIYSGNAQSFLMVAIDLKTHVGRMDDRRSGTSYGRTAESPWREPRAACGAIVGALAGYNEGNGVHQRIRGDLGEENFEFLRKNKITAADGADVTAAVASAIVAIQGMLNTAFAFAKELDERGVAHLTASVTVNRPSMDDPVIYLSRATVFQGRVCVQGLGTDARKYTARMVDHEGDRRLLLVYDGRETGGFPVRDMDPPKEAAKHEALDI